MNTPLFPRFETRSRLADMDLSAYSASKVVRCLAEGQKLDGFEAEVEQQLGGSRGTGQVLGPTVTIPWAIYKGAMRASRAMTAGSPGAGGTLTAGIDVGPAADVLRPYSVAARTGMTVLSGLVRDVHVPVNDEEVNFAWMDQELEAPTFDEVPPMGLQGLRPHIGVGLLKFSDMLVRQNQAQVFELFARRRLLLAAGAAVDRMVLQGRSDGDMAQPLGLSSADVPVFEWGDPWDATRLMMSHGVGPIMDYVIYHGGSDDQAAFVLSPLMRSFFLPVIGSGGGADVETKILYGHRAHTTSAMAGTDMAYGNWWAATLAMWGEGFEIAVDPYTGFKQNQIAMRCFIAMDVAFPQRGALAIARWTGGTP